MGTSIRTLGWLVGASGLIGCAASDFGEPDTPAQNAHPVATSQPDDQPSAPGWRYAQNTTQGVSGCGRPSQTLPWSTEAELGQALPGRWLRCSDAPLAGFDFTPGAVGIDFREDGSWHFLFVDDDRLVTKDEPSVRGQWLFTHAGTEASGPLAIEISNDGQPRGGTWIFQPRFALDPVQMILGEGVRFAALGGPDTAVEGLPLPPPPAAEPSSGSSDNVCAPFQEGYSWSSSEELEPALLGRWLLCADAAHFWRQGEVGIEFLADGRWYLLFADGDTFVTSGGPDLWGLWTFTDAGTGNGGPPAIGLSVGSQPNAGTWIYRPRFSGDRTQMSIEHSGSTVSFSALSPSQ